MGKLKSRNDAVKRNDESSLEDKCRMMQPLSNLVSAYKSPSARFARQPKSASTKVALAAAASAAAAAAAAVAEKASQKPSSPSLLSKIALEKLFSDPNVIRLRNEIREYNLQFISSIDSIVQCWMPKFIIDLNALVETLKPTQDKAVIEQLRAELEANFPSKPTNEEAWELKQLYANFECNSVDSKPLVHRKSMLMPNKPISESKPLYQVCGRIREKMFEANRQLWRLQLGIKLLTPPMDDSNNAGVQLQETILAELRDLHHRIVGFLTEKGWMDYAHERLVALRNFFDVPQLKDARLSLEIVENTNCLAYFQFVESIMTQMMILQNMLRQNLTKIKSPRINHCSEMAAKILI